MSRCAACRTRLARGSSSCPACGRPVGPAGPPTLELEADGWAVDDGAEVALAGGRSSRRWAIGAAVVVLGAAVAASVVGTGPPDRRGAPTTTAAPATTTRPPRATTTRPTTAVAPAEPLAPPAGPLLGETTGLGLLLWAADGVFRLDLDAGTLVRTRLRSEDGDPDLTSVGLVFQALDGPARRLLRPGDERPATVSAASGPFVGEGPPGRLWFVDYVDQGEAIWYRDGTANRIDVPIPAGASMTRPDGVGGLVVQAPGGVYALATPDAAPRRIASGQLLWWGYGRALVAECDDQLRCGATVYDLRSGEARTAPRGFVRGAFAFQAVSPDGTQLLALNDDPAQATLTAVGLGGGITRLGPIRSPCFIAECGGAVVWSPDGRWLFWVSGDEQVSAWRVGLADPIVVPVPPRAPARDTPALSGAIAVDTSLRLRGFD